MRKDQSLLHLSLWPHPSQTNTFVKHNKMNYWKSRMKKMPKIKKNTSQIFTIRFHMEKITHPGCYRFLNAHREVLYLSHPGVVAEGSWAWPGLQCGLQITILRSTNWKTETVSLMWLKVEVTKLLYLKPNISRETNLHLQVMIKKKKNWPKEVSMHIQVSRTRAGNYSEDSSQAQHKRWRN